MFMFSIAAILVWPRDVQLKKQRRLVNRRHHLRARLPCHDNDHRHAVARRDARRHRALLLERFLRRPV